MKQYQAYYARRRAQTTDQADRMAELVADGWTVAAAGRELGVSQQRSSRIWATIKARFGAQAC